MSLEVYKQSRGMTYKDLAAAIAGRTGRYYHPKYLNRVGRGGYHVSPSLAYHLMLTFPDLVLPTLTQKSVDILKDAAETAQDGRSEVSERCG